MQPITTGTDWCHVLNDRLRADITGPMKTRWDAAMAAQFVVPQLTEAEKEAAALRVSNHLASEGGNFRRKVTLADMLEQIAFSRRTAGKHGGGRETLEDAVCSILREPCPHMRWSRAMAPSRVAYRMQILDALNVAGKPAQRDIRTHPRYMMRPADPLVQTALEDLRTEGRHGTLDEDQYLYAVERLLAGARMEPIQRPINDPFARVAAFAAAGVARVDASRATFGEDGL